MAARFELYQDAAREYRFRLKSGNQKTILISEGFKHRESAENCIASVRRNAPLAARYYRKESMRGGFTFELRATNGQCIGVGNEYGSASERDKAIEAVMKAATGAVLVDLTKKGNADG